jgi:hypothetical protein
MEIKSRISATLDYSTLDTMFQSKSYKCYKCELYELYQVLFSKN